jgi:hypothetical protein
LGVLEAEQLDLAKMRSAFVCLQEFQESRKAGADSASAFLRLFAAFD